VTQGSGPQPNYTFNTHNQIVGAPANCTSANAWCYDAAGNLMNDSVHTYTYDAENRLTKVDGGATASYVYDAAGRRVSQTTSGGGNEVLFDLQGNPVAYVVPGSTNVYYAQTYLGGRQLAVQSGTTTYFPHVDWLGTKRAVTNLSGTRTDTCASLPFGDALSCAGTDNFPTHFTGQVHDNESNLDHFLFRQYTSTEGRWMHPDPAGLAAVDITNPQSWNRYAYVNNPLGNVDPLGLSDCPAEEPDCRLPPCDFDSCVIAPPPDPIPPVNPPGYPPPCDNCGPSNPPPTGPGNPGTPANNTAQRLKCAAQFGSNHSIAAAFGAQNNFLANLLGGNSVSGLVNLGLFISGDATPTIAQLASIPLKGAAQGIPVPPGNPGLSGAVGQVRGLAVQSAVAGSYNAIAGVGQETIELGITASGTVATPVAQLGAETLSNVAFGVGVAKFGLDASTFLYGYFVACHP
jgi:RHS repeat-associated protein